MNVGNIKRSKPRFKVTYLSRFNLQSYGDDNLYPQRMEQLLANSATGGLCYDRYATFIEGNGLYDRQFAEFICNRYGESVDDIFMKIAQDVAKYHGFSLHINYDASFAPCDVTHVPFENCRLEEEDSNGYVSYIAVHPDWSQSKSVNGRTIAIDKSTIKKYYPYNPIPSVVAAQVAADGGFDRYRGQLLWVSMDGRNVYPKPIYDKIVTCLSTDEGLDNIKYRNTRNNFMPSGMIVRKRGNPLGIDANGNEIYGDDDNFGSVLSEFQGDENACAIMDVTAQQSEDVPTFVNIEGTNFDSKFVNTEESTIERIYSAFGQEAWYCIRRGKLGFSGDVVEDATAVYNTFVTKERRFISRYLKRVFERWRGANQSGNYDVEPLIYIQNAAPTNV